MSTEKPTAEQPSDRTATTPGTAPEPLDWLHQPGDVVVNRYRVERLLGKGGFASSYLVEDLRLNGRNRALKQIPESCYDETEMEVLSQLRHPAIPDIIDRIDHGGMVYLVLELGGVHTIEDERLRRGGRIPFAVLRSWLQQIGAVLGYLHGRHPPIIHRDLKPDNILLDDQDRIMLIDFGIAKQTVADGETRTLARAATLGYSPPEQVLGTGTDPRSDVYALAATAYRLVTGQVPLAAHERVAGAELTPPSQLAQDLPPRFGDAIVQALSLNMNLRPASVAEFLRPMDPTTVASPTDRMEALDRQPAKRRIDRDTPLQAALTPTPGRTHWKLWAVGAAVAILAIGSTLLLRPGSGLQQPVTAAAVPTHRAPFIPPPAEAPETAAPEVVRPVQKQPAATVELKSRDPEPEPGPEPEPADRNSESALQQLPIKRKLPSPLVPPRESPKENYEFLDATPPSAMQPSQRGVPTTPMAPKKYIPNSGFQ